MIVKVYSNQTGAGWMGWIEDAQEKALGFIRLNGEIVWEW